MTKTTLLAATAIIALTAGAASGATLHPNMVTKSAKPGKAHALKLRPGPGGGGVFWAQVSPLYSATVSDNFTSGHFPTYDSALADDFTYPGTATGGVTEVAVAGTYAGWPGGVNSMVISIYKEKPASSKHPFSYPAKVKHTYTLPVDGIYAGGHCTSFTSPYTTANFYCFLPYTVKKGVVKANAKLKPGNYFVSAVANLEFITSSSGLLANGEWYWRQNNSLNMDEAVWQESGGFATGCTTWTPRSSCIGGTPSDLEMILGG